MLKVIFWKQKFQIPLKQVCDAEAILGGTDLGTRGLRKELELGEIQHGEDEDDDLGSNIDGTAEQTLEKGGDKLGNH